VRSGLTHASCGYPHLRGKCGNPYCCACWNDQTNYINSVIINVQNIRLVNTVSIHFNTIARKTTERSQQKTGFCTFLLKNLQTTLKPHFNKIWSKSYAFQNKATIICKRAKGGSSTTILGHFSKSLPWALNSNIHPCLWGWIFNPCSQNSKTEVEE